MSEEVLTIPMYISPLNALQPYIDDHGEVIYELVGLPAEHGGALQHSLARIILPPGKASRMHFHRQSEESFYILRGNARMEVDQQELILSPGQVCLIQPGEKHRIFNDTNQELEYLAVCTPAWEPGDSYYTP